MKKWTIVVALVVALTLVLTGCEGFDLNAILGLGGKKLSKPVVTVDKDGLATWQEVRGAVGYEYVLNGESTHITEQLSVQLTEGQSISVRALGDGEKYKNSEFSAIVVYTPSTVIPTLAAPTVSVDEEGLATWQAIEGAIGYEYTLGDQNPQTTQETSVQLANGQSIRVRALGDGTAWLTSAYSSAVRYQKQLPTLDAPTLSVDEEGIATWQAIEGASGYEYQIEGMAATRTQETWVQLTNGQRVRVRALGDDEHADSAFSDYVRYYKPIEGECEHTDTNNDELCDSCAQDVTVELDFYSINDLHGKFFSTANQPGVDELTTYLKNAYADESQYEILLSSGDMWQGTVDSSSNKGALMVEWMNAMGFVSMTLGNHEYDWGSEYILRNAGLADFPFLGINVSDSNVSESYCQPSVVVERGGVKIGIIGAIGDCLSSIAEDFTDGLNFSVSDKLTALVEAEAARLRSEGCDLIVYSLHDGYSSSSSSITDVSSLSYYDVALSNGSVDLVFEGHSHQNYILRDSYGVYHVQSGGENKYIGYVKVIYNLANDSYRMETVRNIPSSTYGNSSIADDPIVEELMAKYFPDGDPYTPIGTNDTYRSSSAITDKVAELYYQKGVELWGDEYTIVAGGGYINTRSPYNLQSGNVSYADLYSLLPFDNVLVLGKISGSKLLSRFIEGSYACYASISASEVVSTKYYYIVVDSYSSTYASNGITEIVRLDEALFARDLLRDYIAGGGWGGAVQTTTLQAPVVSVSPTGLASWQEVVGASAYMVVVDGQAPVQTNANSWQLEAGQSMSVKAVGDGSLYLDSAYSATVSYAPTETKTIGVAEALAIGNALPNGDSTTEYYYIRGTVQSIKSTTWGNMYLVDSEGNSLWLYGFYDQQGNRFDAMSATPAVGDEITVYGQITKYVNSSGGTVIEVVNAVWIP